MHNKRLKILIIIFAAMITVCVLRLTHIQLSPGELWQRQIQNFKAGSYKKLPALRGTIYDRNGQIVACDEAQFSVCINYQLARLADRRFYEQQLFEQQKIHGRDYSIEKLKSKYSEDITKLRKIIYKCAAFEQVSAKTIAERIQKQINDRIWKLRTYIGFKRKYPNETFEPDRLTDKQLVELAGDVDLAEMYSDWPLIYLENDDELIAAQLSFIDIEGVKILPQSKRSYKFGSVAAQLVGWVRPFQRQDTELFDDELRQYLDGDMSGIRGVEYVCEKRLRGKRGQVQYNIDGEVLYRDDMLGGEDLYLTVDFVLQEKIEKLLRNCAFNLNCQKPTVAVVIDVRSSEILAAVSLPGFDLNDARTEYGSLAGDANRPLINRAFNKHYPPGSTAKPIVLLAAMEEGFADSQRVISCPSHRPAKGWPRCWRERTLHSGHDEQFAYDGLNNAKNAIKGSCNIYFSRLANELEPGVLQSWLYRLGFGRKLLNGNLPSGCGREFLEGTGLISSSRPTHSADISEELPPIEKSELRYFGIGQGSFQTTVLQAANAMAAIGRDGIFAYPKIFLDKGNSNQNNESVSLDLKPTTIEAIRAGMKAVVSEPGGTANRAFQSALADFNAKGITVFGKTGSTEKPYNAWFAGLAEDSTGKSLAVALVVEGGEHGSSDAAPLARDIISLFAETGYIGESRN